jgi:metal-responsive CopG/Arc/MetJ family transcriptional regulator
MRQRTSITVDELLWRRFRATIALQGKDMSPVIERLIEQYLDEHEAAAREAANQSHNEAGAS